MTNTWTVNIDLADGTEDTILDGLDEQTAYDKAMDIRRDATFLRDDVVRVWYGNDTTTRVMWSR